MVRTPVWQASSALILAAFAVACSDSGPRIGLTDEEAAAVGDQVEGAAAGGLAAGVGVGLASVLGIQSAPPHAGLPGWRDHRRIRHDGGIHRSGKPHGYADE